jgi:hypothetical protein
MSANDGGERPACGTMARGMGSGVLRRQRSPPHGCEALQAGVLSLKALVPLALADCPTPDQATQPNHPTAPIHTPTHHLRALLTPATIIKPADLASSNTYKTLLSLDGGGLRGLVSCESRRCAAASQGLPRARQASARADDVPLQHPSPASPPGSMRRAFRSVAKWQILSTTVPCAFLSHPLPLPFLGPDCGLSFCRLLHVRASRQAFIAATDLVSNTASSLLLSECLLPCLRT